MVRGPSGKVAVLFYPKAAGYEGLVVDLPALEVHKRIFVPGPGFPSEWATIDVAGRWLAIIDDNSLLV
ncbi:MAG: hypothetical protein GY811_26840 [Myxococcales bacterium]|nr:hypothetical protein [Myxococcales bacterium]